MVADATACAKGGPTIATPASETWVRQLRDHLAVPLASAVVVLSMQFHSSHVDTYAAYEVGDAGGDARLALALRQLRSIRDEAQRLDASVNQATLPLGLSAHEFQVLAVSVRSSNEVITQQELESVTGLSQSSLSRLVGRLESRSLVARRRSGEDARSQLVSPTSHGVEMLNNAVPAFLRAMGVFAVEANADLGTDDAWATRSFGGSDEGSEILGLGESVLTVQRESAVAVSDSLHVRDALEPLVLLEASVYRTPDDVADCRRILEQMSKSIERPYDFYKCDWSLHERLAQICQNERLRLVYNSLMVSVKAAVVNAEDSSSLNQYLRRRLVIHEELINAVESGDARRVRQAAAAHRYLTTHETGL